MRPIKNLYERIYMGKNKRKQILLTIGICFLAGSLCACGENENAVIDVADLRESIELPVEPSSEASTTISDNAIEESVEPTPEPGPEVITITISAAGDVTLGNYPEQSYTNSLHEVYDQEQDDAYFFRNVYDIFSTDDMTLVNLEGVLTNATERREGVTYNLKGKPEYVNILTQGSIEAVSMANNHRMDYLQQGTDDTVVTLKEAAITYAYDENIGIYEVKGVRIGYVSVNEVGWGAGVERLIQEGIEKLKEEQVDIILICCHWGIEREYYPEQYQQELGRKCIDWGADLVIGHHPHVLQGIEEYQGKYIVYSLGNFCFGANRNPADKDTMIFQQTFTFVDGEKQEDKNIRVIPCSISSVMGRNNYQPTPAVGEEGTRILEKINDCSKNLGVRFDEQGKPIE